MEGTPGTGPVDPPALSRRLLLRAGAVSALGLALSGCGGERHRVVPGAAPTTSPSATSAADVAQTDIRLVVAALRDEEGALSFCTTASRRLPSERHLVDPVAVVQRDHVARLRAALVRLNPPPSSAGPRVPRRADDLMPSLLRVERDLALDRSTDCLTAVAGPLAVLFGSMRASHAIQESVLRSAHPASPPPVAGPRAVPDVAVFASCLAAEYAAVFGYGVVGGVLTAGVSDGPLASAARLAYQVHRDRRDLLVGVFDAAGRKPPAAQPTYRIPYDVSSPATAARLARDLETRCTAVYLQAVSASTGDGRRFSSDVVSDCAVRAVGWGATPTAFPGLPS